MPPHDPGPYTELDALNAPPDGDDPFQASWFTPAPDGTPATVCGPVRQNPHVLLAALKRELAGCEARLAELVDPGPDRPLDQLAYQQARNEREAYRKAVVEQIKAAEKALK
jgi:hypothetical protein